MIKVEARDRLFVWFIVWCIMAPRNTVCVPFAHVEAKIREKHTRDSHMRKFAEYLTWCNQPKNIDIDLRIWNLQKTFPLPSSSWFYYSDTDLVIKSRLSLTSVFWSRVIFGSKKIFVTDVLLVSDFCIWYKHENEAINMIARLLTWLPNNNEVVNMICIHKLSWGTCREYI